MIVPLVPGESVIVAVRDRISAGYSSIERSLVQRLAAGAAGLADPLSRAGMACQLELISSAVWITDAAGVTSYVNQAACLLVGLPAERIVGVPISEFIDGAAPDLGVGLFFGQEPFQRAVLADDGRTRWLSVSARPLFGRRGTLEALLYTLVDVTERHRHETELRMRLDAEEALARFAELLVVEDDPDRILSSGVELVADQFAASLVTAVAIARDRSEVHPLAIAGELGDLDPQRWRARYELPSGSATLAAIEGDEAVRVGDFSDGCRTAPARWRSRPRRAVPPACRSPAVPAAWRCSTPSPTRSATTSSSCSRRSPDCSPSAGPGADERPARRQPAAFRSRTGPEPRCLRARPPSPGPGRARRPPARGRGTAGRSRTRARAGAPAAAPWRRG